VSNSKQQKEKSLDRMLQKQDNDSKDNNKETIKD
jgi:hypothetical protein